MAVKLLIEKYTVTDSRKAAEKIKGKAYRFKELANGTLVSRDPAFPLDGPKVIEKARAKVEKATKRRQRNDNRCVPLSEL